MPIIGVGRKPETIRGGRVSLVESREWVGPAARKLSTRPSARLHATGAVLFTTLDMSRPLVVAAAGTWTPSQTPVTHSSGPLSTLGSNASRCVSWLLGR